MIGLQGELQKMLKLIAITITLLLSGCTVTVLPPIDASKEYRNS
jgi:uncharacterized protein YceK